MKVGIATTDEEIASCFDVIRELRPHLQRESFVSIVRDMGREGYSLAFCEVEGQVVAVAGFRMKRTLYCDSFLYIDDLVTASDQRSRGIGRSLLTWLEDYAHGHGCASVHLDSGMQRKDAHRFYEANGYIASGYHFRSDQDNRVPWSTWDDQRQSEGQSSGAVNRRIGFVAVDHVQLAMPPGGEDSAREFYGGVLGLKEVPKPQILAARGGVWFEAGQVRIHLGAEADFRPARKAHPAIQVDDLRSVATRLQSHQIEFKPGEPLSDRKRGYADDPFGNRLEFVELKVNPSTKE